MAKEGNDQLEMEMEGVKFFKINPCIYDENATFCKIWDHLGLMPPLCLPPPPCQLPPHIWGVFVTALGEPAPTPVPWLKTSVG